MYSALRKEWGRAIADSGGGGGWDGPPCEECGWRGPDDNSEPERHLVTFQGDKDFNLVPTDEYGEPKEFCHECGRRLVWPIAFDDGGCMFCLKIPKTDE